MSTKPTVATLTAQVEALTAQVSALVARQAGSPVPVEVEPPPVVTAAEVATAAAAATPADPEVVAALVRGAVREMVESVDLLAAVCIEVGHPPAMVVADLGAAGVVGDVASILRDVVVLRVVQINAARNAAGQ